MPEWLTNFWDKSSAVVQYLKLDGSDAASAHRAMRELCRLGDASIPILNHGIRQKDHPVLQSRCAVVLHWLGWKIGSSVLTDVLLYSLPQHKEIAEPLKACFSELEGDADAPLANAWRQAAASRHSVHPVELIQQIWIENRRVTAVEVVCGTCVELPEAFLRIVETFGVDAVDSLARLARNESETQRCLAAAGCSRVPGDTSAPILLNLMRDPVPQVRDAAVEALTQCVGPVSASRALSRLHGDGYSCQASVEGLMLFRPPDAFDHICKLIARSTARDWTNERRDANSAVALCLKHLSTGPISPERQLDLAISAMCGDTPDRVEEMGCAAIEAAIIKGAVPSPQVQSVLLRSICSPVRAVRSQASPALAATGDAAYSKMLDAIAECEPRDSLLNQLKATITQSGDVGSAVSDAMQHVANWITRVSRDYAAQSKPDARAVDYSDPALTSLFKRLLERSLDRICDAPVDDASESIVLSACAAMIALIKSGDTTEVAQLRRALCSTFQLDASPKALVKDPAYIVRVVAGDAIRVMAPQDATDILATALKDRRLSVQLSSIEALGATVDSRAAYMLQEFSRSCHPSLNTAVQNAIAKIKKGNPDMMTLLRGSSAGDVSGGTLLRSSASVLVDNASESLVRPALKNEDL